MSEPTNNKSGNGNGKPTEVVDNVVIRFAGDSGDGMQLTGTRFSNEAANIGNDLRTFPDFPAEIRAPAGTLAGVSAFQLNFSSFDVFTPGDTLDVLVAMNPAALKTNLLDLKPGGVIIANLAQFNDRNLQKAGYESNPLEDGSLSEYRLYPVDITQLTVKAIEDVGLNARAMDRSKNFFALGLMFWMYNRTLDSTIEWIEKKFAKNEMVRDANIKALKAGFFYGETAEIFEVRYKVAPAELEKGTYRNINGNRAIAFGFIAAAELADRQLFLGSYPITPASDILHELAARKQFGVYTLQVEDEIAAIAATIGASFGGALAITTTSGPGVALKSEAMGLATMVELPMVIINVQRGGPSTGLPTKTEQADLFQAVYGRNGEAPMPVIAAATPADCFNMAIEASRIALKYMTPVILLTDGYIANGAEPWKIPEPDSLPKLEHNEITSAEDFLPYARDPETLARPWPRLGVHGIEHRIGGLEKEHLTGGVSYDPQNHEFMCRLREEKIERLRKELPPTEIHGDDSGDLLFIGWGSTFGAIRAAVEELQQKGKKVSQVHLRNIHPLPADLGAIMKRFKTVVVPELNLGQLATVLRGETLIDVKPINKVQGKPFMRHELVGKALELLDGKDSGPYLVETIEHLGKSTGDASTAAFARLH